MPSKLVRVVLDMTSNHFSVEYGEKRAPGLSELDEIEFKQLNQDLIEFSDFTLAEDLDDEERKDMMAKKKRLEELAVKETMEHIEWYPIEEHLINSLFIVVKPGFLHTYVENMPAQLLDKIMDPQITLNVSTGPAWVEGASRFPVEHPEKEEKEEDAPVNDVGGLQAHTPAEIVVIKIIADDTPGWADLLTVKEEGTLVIVRPNKFLGDAWKAINRALREVYGECWKSTGKGDKSAHWEVPI